MAILYHHQEPAVVVSFPYGTSNTASWEGGSALGEADRSWKREEKVHGCSRERDQAYIDAVDVLSQQVEAGKSSKKAVLCLKR